MTGDGRVEMFHRVVREVPAYKEFLAAREFDPDTVRTAQDYATVPISSKKTYLQPNERTRLLWPDDVATPLWLCSTSGSTGEPYYFPRTEAIAARGAQFAENFLKYSSYGQGRTLVLMAFGMGVWIGGLVTLRSFEIAVARHPMPVSFLPTGYNKQEIFKALRKLSPGYDQTILVGYPPFVKEIVDEAEGEGIDLTKLNMRLMFAAEAFTEQFRDYVCQKAGVTNPLLDTLNIYGSADMGAMAHETPLSILARKLALEDPLLYKDVFGQIEKTPTLAQYNTDHVEFEEVDGELIVTSDDALPLIRYAIGDHGGVMTFNHLEQLFRRYGMDLHGEADKAGILHTLDKRPFVFVYERTDLSATLHGIIIYPEFVKEGLLRPEMTPYFTERFTMATKHDLYHNQFLQVNLELQKGVEISDELEQSAAKHIRTSMIQKSSEFSEVSKSRASQKLIQVVLWPNGHPRYFAPGAKQMWAEKP